MSFYLKARNKNLEPLRMGAFSWDWLLNAGVGWPVGFDKGVNPESPLYLARPDEQDGTSGDRVTAAEARQMARLAKMVAEHQDMLSDRWAQLSSDEQACIKNDPALRGSVPVRRDFVEKARLFAAWAETSSGFCVA